MESLIERAMAQIQQAEQYIDEQTEKDNDSLLDESEDCKEDIELDENDNCLDEQLISSQPDVILSECLRYFDKETEIPNSYFRRRPSPKKGIFSKLVSAFLITIFVAYYFYNNQHYVENARPYLLHEKSIFKQLYGFIIRNYHQNLPQYPISTHFIRGNLTHSFSLAQELYGLHPSTESQKYNDFELDVN